MAAIVEPPLIETARLRALRRFLVVLAIVLGLGTVFISETIAWQFANARAGEARIATQQYEALQAQVAHSAQVASCRSQISGDWVNALDLVIKYQAQAIVVVFTQPIDETALQGKRQEMTDALTQLEAADDKRARQDVLCPS